MKNVAITVLVLVFLIQCGPEQGRVGYYNVPLEEDPVPRQQIPRDENDAERMQIDNALVFESFAVNQDGTIIITFELSNILDISLCLITPITQGHYGLIEFFNSQGQAYSRSFATGTTGGRDFKEGAIFANDRYRIEMLEPGESLDITREIYAGMFQNSFFTLERGPFRAQLSISRVTSCTRNQIIHGLLPAQYSNLTRVHSYDFISDLTPAFSLPK